MWTETMLAYVAGFLDGEGHISVEKQSANGKQRKHDYYTLRLVISNTNKEVIMWLISNFQGSLQKCKKVENHKQVYKYVLFGEKLYNLILSIYPYLIVKKPHADIVLKFRETVGKTGWHVSEETLEIRKQLYLEAKKINKPGDHEITSSL